MTPIPCAYGNERRHAVAVSGLGGASPMYAVCGRECRVERPHSLTRL